MSEPMLPPSDYWASLPRHVAAAAVVVHNEHGEVVLVRPTYRDDDTWDLPGGAMDPGEHPWDTARRETAEELSITLSMAPQLLAVDWVTPDGTGRPAFVIFVFDGGHLTPADAERNISLPPAELSAWRYCSPDQWDNLLTPRKARRVHAAMAALTTGQAAYLHDGWPG